MSSAQTASELLSGTPHPSCRAIVIIPACNEEERLPAALEALRLQTDDNGSPLDPDSFEVLVFLNNCSDRSAEKLGRFHQRHPSVRLRWMDEVLSPECAHVGTARKLLMDVACQRLGRVPCPSGSGGAILSTDADTVVAADWIWRNLEEIDHGADAVGGLIEILPAELPCLDPGTRTAYNNDRLYRMRVAQLESLLDADDADPWPRHLEHFGASLACTREIYVRSGGLPCVSPLEDVAFVDAMRRCDARIRHSTRVRVYTSARFEGRADVGFSGQLSDWRNSALDGEPHLVESCSWLTHRFSSLRRLRLLHADNDLPLPAEYPVAWQNYIQELRGRDLQPALFLQELNCNGLIEDLYQGRRRCPIAEVLVDLDRTIRQLTSPVTSAPVEDLEVQAHLLVQA